MSYSLVRATANSHFGNPAINLYEIVQHNRFSDVFEVRQQVMVQFEAKHFLLFDIVTFNDFDRIPFTSLGYVTVMPKTISTQKSFRFRFNLLDQHFRHCFGSGFAYDCVEPQNATTTALFVTNIVVGTISFFVSYVQICFIGEQKHANICV